MWCASSYEIQNVHMIVVDSCNRSWVHPIRPFQFLLRCWRRPSLLSCPSEPPPLVLLPPLPACPLSIRISISRTCLPEGHCSCTSSARRPWPWPCSSCRCCPLELGPRRSNPMHFPLDTWFGRWLCISLYFVVANLCISHLRRPHRSKVWFCADPVMICL
jgi:hypothetical protein